MDKNHIIINDCSLLTMTRASIVNRINGLQRDWDTCHDEFNRLCECMKKSTTDMERNYYRGRIDTTLINSFRCVAKQQYLLNILKHHYPIEDKPRVPDVEIFSCMPTGWRELKGATTAPSGYMWVFNGQPIFTADGKHNPDYCHALCAIREPEIKPVVIY